MISKHDLQVMWPWAHWRMGGNRNRWHEIHLRTSFKLPMLKLIESFKRRLSFNSPPSLTSMYAPLELLQPVWIMFYQFKQSAKCFKNVHILHKNSSFCSIYFTPMVIFIVSALISFLKGIHVHADWRNIIRIPTSCCGVLHWG